MSRDVIISATPTLRGNRFRVKIVSLLSIILPPIFSKHKQDEIIMTKPYNEFRNRAYPEMVVLNHDTLHLS